MNERINKYLHLVNMEEYINHSPEELSGGQKQRVAIAGILAMQPDILILDESTSMLDPKGKNEINRLVRDIISQNKMTVISITHDIEEVTKSDFVIVMNNGQIVMSGKPGEIMMREKELLKSNLDLPFSLKVIKELEKNKIKLNKSVTLEGLVDELCQLNSTK